MGASYAVSLEGVSIEDMDTLLWTEVAPGVWSAQVGAREAVTFTDLAATAPQVEALARIQDSRFPFAPGTARGEVRNDGTSVRLPLKPEERLYGLGLHFRKINRRAEVQHLRVDHYGRVPGRTHAPVPFYVSSEGYGVLFNTVRWISVYPGVGNRKDSRLPEIRDRTTDPRWSSRPLSDAVEASTAGAGMEILVFAGTTPLEAVRRYNLYFGGGVLPPRWGLGFWHRVPTAATAEEVIAETDEFSTRDYPLDVIGLEPGWQSHAYPGSFDWSPVRFPEPARFLEDMTKRNIRVNLWENPYVSPESSIYQDILPLTGSHTVWLGVVPDYTLPAARKILTDHHTRTHLDIGVSGYKIDEVDGIDAWLWPDHATFPSGTSGEVMRQTYGLHMQHLMSDMFRERNQRTYGLVRGSNGGASSLPFAIYSDHYDHRGYVTALANSGFLGILWTPEIRSARSADEWVRRMQTVCFSPMAMLNAWSSGTKPWSKPEVEDSIRAAMKWRLRFLPYLYTAFAQYHFDGIPPFRAMALEEGLDAAASEIDDQYMMGDSLLVAPVFAGEKDREIVLPKGKWYDFYDGKYAGEGETIHIVTSLDRIPLFVKDGGIIPLMPEANNTSAWKEGVPLEIRHYGTSPGENRLYDDDGLSFDYEKGRFSWYELRATRGADGQLQGALTPRNQDYPPTFGEITWRFMTR